MSLQCNSCGATNPATNNFCSKCGAPLEVTPSMRKPRPSSGESVRAKERSPISDFVTLSCPTCGGQLQITKDIDRFACAHCGNEHLVKRGGGIVMLEPVVKGLAKIQRGTDRTAAELAIVRIKNELRDLDRDILRVSQSALDKDLPVITTCLRKMRLLSLREAMEKSRTRLAGQLCDLNVEQAQALFSKYKKRTVMDKPLLGRDKRVVPTRELLQELLDLQIQRQRIQDRLDVQRHIAEGA